VVTLKVALLDLAARLFVVDSSYATDLSQLRKRTSRKLRADASQNLWCDIMAVVPLRRLSTGQ
jgi:hypothetical protein